MKKNDVCNCAVCNETILGMGNNPYPLIVDDEARVCDVCNIEYVIPIRLLRMSNAESFDNVMALSNEDRVAFIKRVMEGRH